MHRYMTKLAEVLKRDEHKPMSPETAEYYHGIVSCVSNLPEEPTPEEIAEHNQYLIAMSKRNRTPNVRRSVSSSSPDAGDPNSSQLFQTPSAGSPMTAYGLDGPAAGNNPAPVSQQPSSGSSVVDAEAKAVDGNPQQVRADQAATATVPPSMFRTPVSRRKSVMIKQIIPAPLVPNPPAPAPLPAYPSHTGPSNATTHPQQQQPSQTSGLPPAGPVSGAARVYASGATYADTVSALLTHLSERDEQLRTQLAELKQKVAELTQEKSSIEQSREELKTALGQLKEALDAFRAAQAEHQARRAAWQSKRLEWEEQYGSGDGFIGRVRRWFIRLTLWFGRCAAKALAYYLVWTLFRKFQNSDLGYQVSQWLRLLAINVGVF